MPNTAHGDERRCSGGGRPRHSRQAISRSAARDARRCERQTVAVVVLIVALLATTLSVSAQSAESPPVLEVPTTPAMVDLALAAGAPAMPSLPLDAVPPADVAASPAQMVPVDSPDEPPTIGWYREAAAQYRVSPYLLQALHQVESSASPDSCMTNLEGSGATGPFQFKRATFREFAVDANHDGQVDICVFSDALFSAARYLHAIGADDDIASTETRHALQRYGTDADRVIALALHYQARAGQVAARAEPPS